MSEHQFYYLINVALLNVYMQFFKAVCGSTQKTGSEAQRLHVISILQLLITIPINFLFLLIFILFFFKESLTEFLRHSYEVRLITPLKSHERKLFKNHNQRFLRGGIIQFGLLTLTSLSFYFIFPTFFFSFLSCF